MSEDREDSKNNKNIWLAISLAIITSVTSLGTAFIAKESPTKKSEDIDFKIFEQKINRDIGDLTKKVEGEEKTSDIYKGYITTHINRFQKKLDEYKKDRDVLKKEVFEASKNYVVNSYNNMNNKLEREVSNSIDRDISMQKEINKNVSRSIICYASLSKEEVERGKSILSILNGDGINKSLNQKDYVDKIIKHLKPDLLKIKK